MKMRTSVRVLDGNLPLLWRARPWSSQSISLSQPKHITSPARWASSRFISTSLPPICAMASTTNAQSPQQQTKHHLPIDNGYRRPPKPIEDIVLSPPEPLLSFSPDRNLVMQLTRPPPHPPVSELARPELKLAGLRIDPESFSRSRMSYYTSIAFAKFTEDVVFPLNDGQITQIDGIPEGYWINYVTWAPTSKHIAFTLRSAGGDDDPPRGPLELWTADIATGKARKLLDRGLNSVLEDYGWIDDDTLVVSVIPATHPEAPKKPAVPSGPRVEDNSAGKKSQARTWPDMLQNAHDEEVFEYYTTSELLTINGTTGDTKTIAPPRIYTSVASSPDGNYLLVAWIERPFSYALPCGRFPKKVELWDRHGKFIREIANLPLAEDIPIAFDSCRVGPRAIGWRDDKPAEISWIECQDGGDPAVDTSPRDIVYTLEISSSSGGGGNGGDVSKAVPRVVAGTDWRCGGVAWSTDDFALLYESEWKSRRSRTWILSPDVDSTTSSNNGGGGGTKDDGVGNKQILFDRNYEDSYSDPGSPLMRRTSLGTYIVAQLAGVEGRKLLMQGRGASTEGNYPFLEVLDVDTKETQRIWQCKPPYNEYTSTILSDLDDAPITLDSLVMLSSRESKEEPPQFFIKNFTDGGSTITERGISNFPHPYPTLKGMEKQILRYKREDGVDLTATFYLPPGYNAEKDGKLPCIVWAYPREFKSKDAAGQLRRSPHQFSSIGSTSPLLWLSKGYAVLDGPTFPIIAEGDDAEPNDTYVQQLTSSARAAVEELGRLGCVDVDRIAVGGHSYGAFMCAGLLAHAPDLFACGIGRSGAYNRTLTPFGFQSEERTLWQVPEIYSKMSPFMQADKITKPLLLIHGEADNNPGTFPMQSERLYQALKGHGAVTRLCVLPYESHSYVGLESVLHCLYEMDAWMEQHMNGNGGDSNGAK